MKKLAWNNLVRICIFLLFFLFLNGKAQIIVDNTTYTPQQLVADKFIGTQNSSCVNISNVTVSGGNLGGSDSSYGYFSKGSSSFNINEGIILSTGSVLAAPGPKSSRIQSATANNWDGDPDLALALGKSDLSNATILEFDFSTSLSDKVSFRYMFLSEEYYPGNYKYSDAFAFLIKKVGSTDPYQNIALVPGTNLPVSVSNINARDNNKYFDDFIGFKSYTNGTNDSPTNFNGQTKVLTAVANVDPGVKYHIKLVIADETNPQYDSAVFLEAGSFTGNIDLLPNIETNDAAILCDPILGVTLKPKNPSAITDPNPTYAWYEESTPGLILSNSSSFPVYKAGNYRLEVVLSSGCTLTGNVRVEDAPIAQIDNSPIPVCDDDFDGKFSTILSDHTFQIVKNYSRDFNISYSLSPNGASIDPDSKFEFTQNPQTIYARVGAFSCTSTPYAIQFYHGSQLSMNYPQSSPTPPTFDICDDELKGSKTVDLNGFVDSEMTKETGTNKIFYNTEPEAKKGGPSTITNINPTLNSSNSDKTYFVRIEKSGSCPNYSSFRLLFKQPKKSTVLKDTLVCKGTFADLDAGTGFDANIGSGFTSYKWSTGETSQSIKNKPAGDYWVELGFNGCVYKQSVKISEPQDLVINNALIEGNRVTVLASNGVPPYRFKLDSGNYQSSNVFENVQKGDHTIEVMDACGNVLRDFSIINVKNVITPNGDGINDSIDYSDLMTKLEPRFEVYDRNGVLVFKGDTNNQFVWNGSFNGRVLPTSSYWYILEWNESGNPNRVQFSGWILLKNRN